MKILLHAHGCNFDLSSISARVTWFLISTSTEIIAETLLHCDHDFYRFGVNVKTTPTMKFIWNTGPPKVLNEKSSVSDIYHCSDPVTFFLHLSHNFFSSNRLDTADMGSSSHFKQDWTLQGSSLLGKAWAFTTVILIWRIGLCFLRTFFPVNFLRRASSLFQTLRNSQSLHTKRPIVIICREGVSIRKNLNWMTFTNK